MSSGSEQKCSIDELKRLNQPQELTPPAPSCPIQEQWAQVVSTLKAQYRLLERIYSAMETMATQSEKLTKEAAEICQKLEQAGKKKERRLSLPRIHLPTPSLAWLWAIPILVGLYALWPLWAILWNVVKLLLQQLS